MRWRGGSVGARVVRFGASAASIVALQAALDRLEEEAVRAVDEDDDEQDDDEEDGRAVVLARQVEEVAEARAAADKFGGERHLPGDAEADPHGGEHEGVERGNGDADESLQA